MFVIIILLFLFELSSAKQLQVGEDGISGGVLNLTVGVNSQVFNNAVVDDCHIAGAVIEMRMRRVSL